MPLYLSPKVNPITGIFKLPLLRSYILNNIGKVPVPEGVPAINRIACFDVKKEFCEQMVMPNEKTAYLFLIDEKQKVRWKGMGAPSGAELDMVRGFVEQLADAASSSS